MGGLMTRSYVKKYAEGQPSYQLSLVVTINSPMYGMKGAEIGLKFSPIAIASWRDVASDSDYVERVHQWHWPKEIPYALIFSYLPGESDDGVVALSSQLSLSLQEEADYVIGFEAQHIGLLDEKVFLDRFNQILLGSYK